MNVNIIPPQLLLWGSLSENRSWRMGR